MGWFVSCMRIIPTDEAFGLSQRNVCRCVELRDWSPRDCAALRIPMRAHPIGRMLLQPTTRCIEKMRPVLWFRGCLQETILSCAGFLQIVRAALPRSTGTAPNISVDPTSIPAALARSRESLPPPSSCLLPSTLLPFHRALLRNRYLILASGKIGTNVVSFAVCLRFEVLPDRNTI